jgi:N-acetylglucosaminyldiphosphoundecaprenol N-acetyl-beta-D-mannosaminyltransferase
MPIDVAARRERHSALAGIRRAPLPHAAPRDDRFERDVHCVLGLPIDAVGVDEAVARVRDAVARREPCFLSTPNLNFVVTARSDAEFRESVIASDLCVADGMPLVWVARLCGIPVIERVAGADVFQQLKNTPGEPLGVYIYGGAEGVAAAAERHLNEETSGLVCVGHESPGYGPVETLCRPASLARINASGADFLVVSLGAKKGQSWIGRNLARLGVPVVSHLGAVVNFAAGTVLRAPAWMQRCGLEWLWRIRQERRLIGRYLADGIAFLRLVFTRVLPYWWHVRMSAAREPLNPATFQVQDSGAEIVIRLRGAWTRGDLDPLRACFARVAAAKRHVRLDLSRVQHVDSAFLGLALVLYGAQRRELCRLVCAPVSPAVEKTFRYACCEFMLGWHATAPARVPASADLREQEQTSK